MGNNHNGRTVIYKFTVIMTIFTNITDRYTDKYTILTTVQEQTTPHQTTDRMMAEADSLHGTLINMADLKMAGINNAGAAMAGIHMAATGDMASIAVTVHTSSSLGEEGEMVMAHLTVGGTTETHPSQMTPGHGKGGPAEMTEGGTTPIDLLQGAEVSHHILSVSQTNYLKLKSFLIHPKTV
jgi:hypothetical protein